MGAVAVWTWVGVAVLAVVVLGFGAYEVVWKLRRLNADVEGLLQVRGRLVTLQESLARAQASAAAIARQRAVNAHANGDALFPNPKDPGSQPGGHPSSHLSSSVPVAAGGRVAS